MQMSTRRAFLFGALVAMLATGAVASLLGAAAAGPGGPTVVATVNLVKINGLLDEIQHENAKLEEMVGPIQSELDTLETEVRALRQDLGELDLPPADRLSLEARIAEKEAVFEIRLKKYRSVMDREKGRVLAKAYRGVLDAARTLAEREGYDLVLIDNHMEMSEIDSLIESSATIAQVSREINSRPVLHVSGAIDVTEEVARIMNNKFRAARAGG